MKHKMKFISLLFGVMLLAACGNSTGENVVDMGSITEGSWMGYNGETVEDPEMMSTDFIDYDSSQTYEINRSSYVSFYAGEEFIETVLYGEEPPMTLDTVEEADRIIISFNQYNEDAIELKITD